MRSASRRKAGRKPEARSQKLRHATFRDCPALVSLERVSFPDCDQFSLRAWRHLLRSRSAIILVCHDDKRLAGAIVGLSRKNSESLRIYSIAVDPCARGHGLGARLILGLIARAPRCCGRVVLEVREKNRVRRLYEHLGMQPAEALPRYYPDGAHGIRYRADLLALRSSLRAHLNSR